MKFIKPALNKSLPPAGTFTGTRTVPSEPQPGQPGSAKTSQSPKFSTRPLPCRSKTLLRLIHRSVPRFASGPFNVSVAELKISNRPRRNSNGALSVGFEAVRNTALLSFKTMPAAVTEVSRLTV